MGYRYTLTRWATAFGVPALLTLGSAFQAFGSQAQFDVITHHYNNFRTGWNQREQILTPATVQSSSFGLLYTVNVDATLYAQPLVVSNQTITGLGGRYEVVYVATENNTVYAINAANGTILLQRNFGAGVNTANFGGCGTLGIEADPVIDLAQQAMYVITYALNSNSQPAYTLHALDLSSLNDKVPPVTVTASHTLANGSQYTFLAQYSRLRAALLQANGNIYAAFASFCDLNGDVTRGWVLGWHAATLTPFPANEMTNTLASSPQDDVFLASIWMSGAGIAADESGNLFFVTANSKSGSYDGVHAIQESAVKMSPDLTTILSIFTPAGSQYGVNTLDQHDKDFGSGGITLLPKQSGPDSELAVAAGKDGQMYLMNRKNLGGYGGADGTNAVLGTYPIGACFCAQSYFTGTDGTAYVVTSGGSQVNVWALQSAPTVALNLVQTSPQISTGGDGGFFTSVSSNNTEAGSYIIWAVANQVNSVALHAIFMNPPGDRAFTVTTGSYASANINSVPVVANGKVFVGVSDTLAVFGLGAPSHNVAAQSAAASSAPNNGSGLFGTIQQVFADTIVVKTADGALVTVDTGQATRRFQSSVLFVGRSVLIQGKLDGHGVLHATKIVRAFGTPDLQGPPQ